MSASVRAEADALTVPDEASLTDNFHPKFTYPVCSLLVPVWTCLKRHKPLDFRRGGKDLWL